VSHRAASHALLPTLARTTANASEATRPRCNPDTASRCDNPSFRKASRTSVESPPRSPSASARTKLLPAPAAASSPEISRRRLRMARIGDPVERLARVTWRAGCSNRPNAPIPRRSRRRTRLGEPGFRGSRRARSAISARIRSPRFASSRLRNPIGVSPPINRTRAGRRGAFGSTARTSATSTRHQPGPDAVSTAVPSMATDSDGRCTTAAATPNCKASETAPARKASATDSARSPAGPGPIAKPATSSVTPATAATSRPSQPRSAIQIPRACANASTGSSRTQETRGPGPQP